MKTALVTTCWLGTNEYIAKTIKWVNYYEAIGWRVTRGLDAEIIILDNSSPYSGVDSFVRNTLESNKVVVEFDEHFDRPSHLDYKYLWRAVYYFQEIFNQGYDKIIYMDNDFYLLSDKMLNFVNDAGGWTSPWCPRHNFPETGLQIITSDCKAYRDFVKAVKPGEYPHNGLQMEDVLPLTHVEKGLVGDRYSETGLLTQTDTMDFMAQTKVETFPIFGVKNARSND